ncbi:MAG: hypothetical protein IPN34_15140 [Planctomycetes bacterium]|nr:hypothetical protein [Planctomycetota bacterium]
MIRLASLVALAFLVVFAPRLSAQKAIPEPRAGLSFAPPKGWAELPGDGDRRATLRLFAGPNAVADKDGVKHTPLLRVQFFAAGGEASSDEVDGLPRTTPFRGLEDFARRGLGASEVEKSAQKVGALEGQRVVAKAIPGERLLIGVAFAVEGGEAALCIELLAQQADKLKKEVEAALASIAPVARVTSSSPDAPWLDGAAWSKMSGEARKVARRTWAEQVVNAAAQSPETGYKVSKSKLWTVLSATDPGYTKKAIGAAEAVREWLAKKLPEIASEPPHPAVLRLFDNVDQYNAFLTTRTSTREYDALHRELWVVNDRDNGGPTGWGQAFRAVLWQLCDDVDPGVLPAMPRWLDNGFWEFLRSSKFDGKKLEFLSSEVERGRIEYYRQNDKEMPALWHLMQEQMQPSPKDGAAEQVWGYTPECARLIRWIWLHDGAKAFEKPSLLSDYIKALGQAHANKGADPTLDVPLVGLSEAQQKERNSRYYIWRDALLIEMNSIAIPLQVETWQKLNGKWLEFNQGFK